MALALASLAAIALLTLRPIGTGAERHLLLCLACGEFGTTDVLLNVALFAPLGAGLHLAGLRRRAVFALALAATVAIESAQYLLIPGRFASLGDVAANSAGALLGAWLVGSWRPWLLPDPRRAARIAAVAAVAWTALLAGSGWALRAAPTDRSYVLQVAPHIASLADFTGDVSGHAVNGESAQAGRLATTPAVTARMRRDSIELAATVRCVEPQPRLAAVLRLVDLERNELALLGQRGRDIVFRARMRAAALRLRTPRLALRDALPERPGDDGVRIVGARVGDALAVDAGSASDAQGSARARLTLAPTRGWMLLVPYSWNAGDGQATMVATSSWILVALAAIGWWSGRATRAGGGSASPRRAPGAALLPPLLAMAGGLWLVPLVLGYPPSRGWEWIAAAAGACIGAALGAVLRSPDCAAVRPAPEAAPGGSRE